MDNIEGSFKNKLFMNNRIRQSIRFKIIFVVIVSISLVVLGVGAFSYYNQAKLNYDKIDQNFSLVADLLSHDSSRWLSNRQNDVTSMSINPMVLQSLYEIKNQSSQAEQAKKQLVSYWRKVCLQYKIYDEIYFATPEGKILVSTNEERIETIRPKDDIIEEPLRTGKTFFENAFLSQANKPSVAFAAPVASGENPSGGDKYIGVLVYRMDVETVIKPMLEGRVNLGSTGEIILVDENRTAITGVRDHPSSTLNYKLKSEAADRVSRGEDGIYHGLGYDGSDMISVYRYVPMARWGIIVRQETREILAPAKEQLVRDLLLSTLASMLLLGVLYIILNRFLRPISRIAEVAKEIAEGDFSRRVQVVSKDEVGLLGETFNSMAEKLGEQFKLQNNRSQILGSLVSDLNLQVMLNKLLTVVCKSFNFQVGAVYLADFEQGILSQKAVYCPGNKLAEEKLQIRIEQGLEGLTFSTGQVQFLEYPAEDNGYTVDWMGTSMPPAAIVQIPLMFGQQCLGVMSLASLQSISIQQVEELALTGNIIGVAVSNARTYLKSCELSEKLQNTNEQLAQQNEELNAQSEELQAQSEELQAQSEELQTIARELQTKNEQLQEQGLIKTKFFATLSHELKAPLNAVIGFSDVLLDRVVGNINLEQEKYLQEIHNGGQHLLNLIIDLLDISRIEANQVRIELEEIDPAVPLEEALAIVNASVLSKDIQLSNLISRDTYLIKADKGKLKQIFINLLTNAVKFTPNSGQITIGAKQQDSQIKMWVADTGIGIAFDYQQMIFEEFKQAPNTINGGTGLGLPITKRLLELQGGAIEVESQEGYGAKFIFTLPMALKSNEIGFTGVRCDVKSTQSVKVKNIMLRYLAKPLQKAELLNMVNMFLAQSGHQPKILLVDDDANVRTYVNAVLSPHCNVFTAADGWVGLEQAVHQVPDILILDISMPGLDGFQVMEALAKHQWKQGLIVYIATSLNLTREEKHFLEKQIS